MMGFWQRLSYAFRGWFSILVHGRIPDDIARQLLGREAKPATAAGTRPPGKLEPVRKADEPPETVDRALQMLALLQREGRLVDFLFEDVNAYPDAQLGAAVRSVHQSCREVFERYLKLAPIINSEEDQPVTLQAAIDPASIKLIGNITSGQPIRGVLRHRGWRAVEVNLPSLPEGAGRKVIAPAEVEV
ncbi:MAG: DUF2760 domain-containing protein [Terriglobales bacterium]